MSEDLQFVDADQGDYRLRPNSPCIDAGLNEKWMEEQHTTIDGKARIQNGTVDIGAFETQSPVSEPGSALTSLDTYLIWRNRLA